jgi:hypothetical protein
VVGVVLLAVLVSAGARLCPAGRVGLLRAAGARIGARLPGLAPLLGVGRPAD